MDGFLKNVQANRTQELLFKAVFPTRFHDFGRIQSVIKKKKTENHFLNTGVKKRLYFKDSGRCELERKSLWGEANRIRESSLQITQSMTINRRKLI